MGTTPGQAAERSCAEPGCERPVAARGLCNVHYKERQRAGMLPPRASLEERLWARVSKTDGCWEWTGPVKDGGWGYIYDGAMRPVHRVAYELNVGRLVEGQVIKHRCGNHICVRPDHLYQEPR